MAMNENDIRLGARGFSPRDMLSQPAPQPSIDPRLIEALAQILSQQGGLQSYGQLSQPPMAPDAFQNAQYEQDQRAQFGMPDPTQGFAQGGPTPAPDLALANEGWMSEPAGTPFEDGSVSDEANWVQDMSVANAPAEPAPKPKKKKGEFSEFFKLLAAAKKEDKKGSTRKAFKDLAKQLDSGSSDSSQGTIPVS